jgi:nucleoside 2-deoxyribosyltransferase
MVIALLEGPQVDDGTAWEIGFFYRGKPKGAKIIGVRTDFRNAGAVLNAMVEYSCNRIVRSSEALLEAISPLIC